MGRAGLDQQAGLTGARHLTIIEVTLEAGFGHNFHKHPDQEEVIYVLAGEIEQWLEADKRVLHAGDSIFIAPNVVHASFNVGTAPARLHVALGPCVGAGGYELVDVSAEAPWNGLR